eukprot:CFRG2902T1
MTQPMDSNGLVIALHRPESDRIAVYSTSPDTKYSKISPTTDVEKVCSYSPSTRCFDEVAEFSGEEEFIITRESQIRYVVSVACGVIPKDPCEFADLGKHPLQYHVQPRSWHKGAVSIKGMASRAIKRRWSSASSGEKIKNLSYQFSSNENSRRETEKHI